MLTPFFSIIIPTYNRSHLIKRAIDSVLSQDFRNYELIVVDDGSTDDTHAVIEENYGQKIKYTYQENKGVCAARNHGAKLARGKFLIFLDSDDWLTIECLVQYENYLLKESYKLVLGKVDVFNNSLQKLHEIIPRNHGTYYRQGLTGSFAIAKNVFIKIGGYDEKLNYSENSDLFLRIRLGTEINMDDITTTKIAGVCIVKENGEVRKSRYNLKKYQSIKYFLNKHKVFFKESKKDFINFQSVLAFSAFQINKYKEARMALLKIIFRYPLSVKTYFQYILFLLPLLASKFYARS